MTVVSSFLTFPAISWWMQVADAHTLVLDGAEHFEKMSYRNRYRISGANNSILLSVPLVNGRNQRVPMKEVQIFNGDNWQVQHWRTLVSVYRRTPYFEHFEHTLRPLYETKFDLLTDFNRATIQWAQKQLKLNIEIQESAEYIKQYAAEVTDIRNVEKPGTPLPHYYQVFEDRIGFVPDLSILDLLFSEGPAAKDLLKGCN